MTLDEARMRCFDGCPSGEDDECDDDMKCFIIDYCKTPYKCVGGSGANFVDECNGRCNNGDSSQCNADETCVPCFTCVSAGGPGFSPLEDSGQCGDPCAQPGQNGNCESDDETCIICDGRVFLAPLFPSASPSSSFQPSEVFSVSPSSSLQPSEEPSVSPSSSLQPSEKMPTPIVCKYNFFHIYLNYLPFTLLIY